MYCGDSDFYRKLTFFKIASNIFELNFIPSANRCVVERRAIFKHMLHVTTDLYVYIKLCFGMSSVKQVLQIEINQFQFYLEQFYKIFKRTFTDLMLSLQNTQA